MKDRPDDALRWKFEIEWNGRHIGWVSSYCIDENYEWVGNIKDGQTVYRAIGIDICEPDLYDNGIGTKTLRAFIKPLFCVTTAPPVRSRWKNTFNGWRTPSRTENRKHKKSLLSEQKCSNRRDFLLCDYRGNIIYSIKAVSILL